MADGTKVDKDYLEGFNQGYEVAKELGLKPNAIEGISAGGKRMQGMKDGMEQFSKELIQEKDKDVIPPLDLDSIESKASNMDMGEDKEKGLNIDI